MSTITHTPSLSGRIALQFARVLKALESRYSATEVATVVAGSGNPVGA